MGSVPFALGLGVVLAVAGIALERVGRRLRARRRFRPFTRRWCTLDRQTRRRIVRAIRTGHGVPAEHAAITLELLDLGDVALARLLPTLWRRAIRNTALNLAGLALAVLLVHQQKVFPVGKSDVQAGYVGVGFFMTSNLVQALWWLRVSSRIPRALANRASARAEAERYRASAT